MDELKEDIYKINRDDFKKLKDIYFREIKVFIDFYSMSVPDYAEFVLGLHRTTVSDWIAGRFKKDKKLDLKTIEKLVDKHGLQNVLSIYDNDIQDFRKKRELDSKEEED